MTDAEERQLDQFRKEMRLELQELRESRERREARSSNRWWISVSTFGVAVLAAGANAVLAYGQIGANTEDIVAIHARQERTAEVAAETNNKVTSTLARLDATLDAGLKTINQRLDRVERSIDGPR